MSYTKQEFKSGEKLFAAQLNAMDEQIAANEEAVGKAISFEAQTLTEEQKVQARENIGAAPMSLFNIIDGDDATKLTSIMPSEDAFLVGKFIHYSTGEIIDNSTNWRCVDDYIAIPVGARLMTHYSANNIKSAYPYVVYYDENKTFISSEDPGTLTQEEYDGKLCAFYNVPQNARFIRLSVPENIFSEGYFRHLYLYFVTDVKVNGGVEIPELIIPELNQLSEEIGDVVKFTPQTLTDEQKAQARENIGVVTEADKFEFIGDTPITTKERTNITLESSETDVETSFEIKTPTIWNFDDDFENANVTCSNCTLEKVDGYYKVTADDVTAFYKSYVRMLVPVEPNKTYTLCWDTSASLGDMYGDGPNDYGGTIALYDGDTSLLIKSGILLDYSTKYTLTPTTNVLHIRLYPIYSPNTTAMQGSIARFNKLWLNEGETNYSLTDVYQTDGVFVNRKTIGEVPKNAVITTSPAAKVYKKVSAEDERIDAIKKTLPLYEKTIVNFGDSIFGNAQPPTDISTFLAEKTGATVYNCGFGGCRMSPHSTAEYHAFSMYKLADAISTGDFTEQENAVNSTTVTLNNAIKSNFATLKTIDFSKVDIVTIAYGANDFNGAQLDSEENPLDTTTFGGALRYSIETLLAAYPHLRIFILSTTWRFWINENNEYVDDTNTHTNSLGKLTSDYNAQLKAVAEEYNLPFIDDYNIGIGKYNRLYYFNANDGAHHKTEGRKVIAAHLAKKLW